MTHATCEATESNAAPTATPGNDLTAMVQQGADALEAGDLRAALECFEQVIDAFPEHPEGHNNLGALYSSLGEFQKAETAFDRVLAILPGNPNILYNRGVVRSRQEKFIEARDDFQHALKASPRDADIHNNLGVLEFAQGRLKQARKHFLKARKFDPAHCNVVLNLCDVEEAEGRHSQAIDHCEGFLAQHNSLEVRRRLLNLLSSGCRSALERASREAEVLLQSDGQNQAARLELGRLIQARNALTAAEDQAHA